MRLFPLLTLLIATTAYARPAEVVVTAFGPFGSFATNPSVPIAEETVRLLRENGVRAKFCQIDTTYDRAFGDVMECIEGPGRRSGNRPPKLVLSLGVGGACTKLFAETTAVNFQDAEGADRDGAVRTAASILLGAPAKLTLPFDFDRMASALTPPERDFLFRSEDAGTYVCNSLMYRMARRFRSDRKFTKSEFAFFHLPAPYCHANLQRVDLWSPIIAKMALAATGRPAKTKLEFRFESPPVPTFEIPRVKAEVPRVSPAYARPEVAPIVPSSRSDRGP